MRQKKSTNKNKKKKKEKPHIVMKQSSKNKK
jgi:hypothetical protein